MCNINSGSEAAIQIIQNPPKSSERIFILMKFTRNKMSNYCWSGKNVEQNLLRKSDKCREIEAM